ncbi:Rne/Rng family ribonuclease [Nonomuraea jiangxiensis]|uniref:Ribonuclease E n=1 Tax=Nonomuraea jiangxiensis TaxID=633440 RepID=A0A1G9S7E2_9ACTN|nr:Rne/Rng family ribonuclease [Nonomuraea jiangxiensis]SDM31342.1 ribonuclease E [Nonomuraea jiangxiensis]
MLDNEPNGVIGPDGETIEQPEVTQRRRSASRPAGPPPELPDEPATVPITVSAAQTAPSVAEVQEVRRTAAQRAAGEPGPEILAAASEAGTTPAPLVESQPPVVETPAPRVESPAEAVVAAAVTDAAGRAVDEAVTGAADEAVPAAEAVEEKPKRATRTRSTATTTRRRTTTKKAAEAQPEAAGALPEEEAPAEEAAPKRRRTRKKAEPEEAVVTSEAPATAEEELSAPAAKVDAPAGNGQIVLNGAAAGAAQAAGELEAAEATRTGDAEVRAGEVQGASEGAEDDEDILEILPEDEPLDDEPAGEDLDEDVVRPSLLADPFGFAARRQDEPGAAFQRPAAIFAPLFQAPDPSKATKPVTRRVEPQPEPEPEEVEELVDETATEDETDADTSDDQEEEGGGRRRRRRRGGRGRGKSRERDEAEDGEDSEDEESEEEQGEEAQEEEAGGSRRRRRRRRRGSDDAEPASDDPPNTVVRIRAPRSGRAAAHDTATDGVQSVRGSTRLEAKKQRRREGRELGRRRPPIITESEFLARRESVDRMMVVRRQGDRTQIAVLEDGVLVEHYVNREASQSYVGNVYLGKVQNVLPSMEAAFVDIGKGRNAVLYAGEVNFDTAGLEGQPKRIEAALKSGQSVLVQVTKDPIGHKGARLTSQISLPGRYLVYVPDGSMTGISRKLPDKERTRLKSILKKVMPENAGVIVRTAAEGASEEELARDVARLSAQWENIQKKAKSASPPELLSAEPDLTIRVVRDVFNEDFTSLVVQGGEAWDTVDEYVKYVAPHLAERLAKWDGGQDDVFESYRIDEQLAKALDRKVWLPSGGSLVIDRTEAMTVVDVNTGKFTGQGGNLEETVTRNNLEAAEEIVRQLRLRDIGGIIVIDFIDMVLESNRDLVLRRLLECLARDRTKHQVAEVTSLGLVQMTRKRVGQGLLEAFSTPCECCNGRGLLISTEPVEAKPEPRGTQGKMAVEKAVADKVSAAKDSANRDTVTGALEDVPVEDDQASQTSGRGRRRSRRTKSAE